MAQQVVQPIHCKRCGRVVGYIQGFMNLRTNDSLQAPRSVQQKEQIEDGSYVVLCPNCEAVEKNEGR